MTTKNLIPRASGEGGIGITDVTWGYGYYDTGNFNKGLFVKGSGIEDVIANTVTQGGLGGEWTRNGLDIYYNGGNVGIGTTDPSAALHVLGTTDNLGGLMLAPPGVNIDSFRFWVDAASVAHINRGGNKVISIKADGNVGIGTTDPATALEINKGLTEASPIITLSRGGTSKSRFAIANATDSILDGALTDDLCIRTEGGNIRFGTESATKTDMSILSSGNVGIGVVAPLAKLDILKGGGTQYDAVDDVFQNFSSEHALKLSTGGWRNAGVINQQTGATAASLDSTGLYLNSSYGAKIFSSSSVHVNCDYGNGDISFLTGNGDTAPTTKIKIQNNGRLGIGTTAPGTELDVVGRVSFSKIPCNNDTVPASLFTGAAMSFLPASSSFGTGRGKDIGISFGSLHGAGGTGVGETDLLFGAVNPAGSPQEIMKLKSDGGVRIGRNSSENSQAGQQFYGALLPGGSLEIRAEEDVNAANAQLRIVGGSGLGSSQPVTGSLYIDNGGAANTVAKFKISQDTIGGEIYVVSSSGGVKLTSGGTTWAPATSDRRAKENISPLENVLEKVLKLSPSRFDFKEEYGNKDQIGFIAQDVNEVLPEFHIPGETEEEMSTVKFSDTATTALLVKAIQEQQQLIEDLKSRIETLENK